MILGVEVAMLHNGQILLTQREDWEVWCLPGGAVEENESLAAAAIRETREETGLEVRLTRLVGTYSRPYWTPNGYHIVVFAAEWIGGTLQAQPEEVIDLRFFGPKQLPEALLWGQHERIKDVLSGASGLVCVNDARQPDGWPTTRQERYDVRDQSGLSRQAFYLQYKAQLPSEESRVEVGLRTYEKVDTSGKP